MQIATQQQKLAFFLVFVFLVFVSLFFGLINRLFQGKVTRWNKSPLCPTLREALLSFSHRDNFRSVTKSCVLSVYSCSVTTFFTSITTIGVVLLNRRTSEAT